MFHRLDFSRFRDHFNNPCYVAASHAYCRPNPLRHRHLRRNKNPVEREKKVKGRRRPISKICYYKNLGTRYRYQDSVLQVSGLCTKAAVPTLLALRLVEATRSLIKLFFYTNSTCIGAVLLSINSAPFYWSAPRHFPSLPTVASLIITCTVAPQFSITSILSSSLSP